MSTLGLMTECTWCFLSSNTVYFLSMMQRKIVFRLAVILAVSLLVVPYAIVNGCSGDGNRSTGDPLTDRLLNASDADFATFSLTGNAACARCVEQGLLVGAIEIEIIPEADPTNIIAMDVLDGLGPFSFKTLRYQKGAILRVSGALYTGTGLSQSPNFRGTTTVTVPENDDASVAFTINFK